MKKDPIFERMVTVITLSYQSKYLYETIDSVLNQTYEQIQYIISDDGSESFQTEEIKEYISHNHKGNICDLVVLHHKENMGTVKNLNQALTFVKGDLILYLSADDLFYDEEVIQDWVDFFSGGKFQIATALRAIYDRKTGEAQAVLPSRKQIQLLLHGKKEDIFDELVKANFIFHCNIVYTKQFMEEHLPYDERYRLIEDHPMNLRWVRMGMVFGFLDRISILYSCDGASSPLNLNQTYLKDVKKIYKNEVFPFTNHPAKNRFYYFRWKMNHINESRFLKGYLWCKQHPIFWIFLALAHPVKAYWKIIRTLGSLKWKGRKT